MWSTIMGKNPLPHLGKLDKFSQCTKNKLSHQREILREVLKDMNNSEHKETRYFGHIYYYINRVHSYVDLYTATKHKSFYN